MFGAILTATNSSFQKGMIFCRSTYVKKVMKLLAFIFEQPSYIHNLMNLHLQIQNNLAIRTGVVMSLESKVNVNEESVNFHSSVKSQCI